MILTPKYRFINKDQTETADTLKNLTYTFIWIYYNSNISVFLRILQSSCSHSGYFVSRRIAFETIFYIFYFHNLPCYRKILAYHKRTKDLQFLPFCHINFDIS